ncbi:unnamed protein product [Haemonchus placei]|uniref:Zinc metalloproteinase n=1 Tax=Haemonchus placei TaxID=6290 RepID=A0A158QRL7_HAEPC|nr:unnamed protein product [Haemonchus placei]
MGKRLFNRAAIGILILVLFDHGLCLSEKGRIALQKALRGVDLEKRLERLQKLGRHRGRAGSNNTRPIPTLPDLTGEDASIFFCCGALAAEDMPSGDGSSILEVNRVEGVDEYLFDGDIILTDEELKALENQAESSARKKRQISTTSTNWADNTVYYYFDATIPAGNQAYIKAVLKYLSGRTCINFVENPTAPNRIQVFDGAGCYSAVGMRGGEQPLSLSQGCIVIGTVAHEFMHALGALHMHMRDDRDNHIKVDLTNVPEARQHNFIKEASTINLTPYEYGSNMHYSRGAHFQMSILKNATKGYRNLVDTGGEFDQTVQDRSLPFLFPTERMWGALAGEEMSSGSDGSSIVAVNSVEGLDEYLFEGDILLTDEELSALENENENDEGGARKKRQISSISKNWENNTVFYYFDASIGAANQAYIRSTLKYLSSRTCIDFVENPTAPNRIQVFDGSGCYSSVGMKGNEQTLSLAQGCIVIGTVAHEFMHALGALHMHMRDDRDDHLKVDLTNVPEAKQSNFLKQTRSINHSPYEYGSTMHYSSDAICCSGQLNQIWPSALNPTPIVSYSIRQAATFTYQYRYV